MAVALHESARRHVHVSALLSLAHALAHAGTSQEIARRLAEALPSVVDCDRAAVWRLGRSRAGAALGPHLGLLPGEAELHRQTKIDARSSPLLSRILAAPEPVFLTPDSDDPIWAR